jgi:Family of unknown function (DUF6220)
MPSNGAAMSLRRIYEIGVYVLVADILLQFYLAGLGIFGSADFLDWHRIWNALVMFVLSIALVVLGWLVHEDRLTVGMPGIIVGLILLQSLLLAPMHMDAPLAVRTISGLHVVNALVIFWVALQFMDRVRHPRTAARA